MDRHRAGCCVEQLMPLVRVGLDDISTWQPGGQGTDCQEWLLFHGEWNLWTAKMGYQISGILQWSLDPQLSLVCVKK